MRRRMEKCVAAALMAVALSAVGAESTLHGEDEDGSVHLSTLSAGNRVHTKIPSVQTVHAFYYVWYGNPETDGEYKHWNHEVRRCGTRSCLASLTWLTQSSLGRHLKGLCQSIPTHPMYSARFCRIGTRHSETGSTTVSCLAACIATAEGPWLMPDAR